MENKKGIIIFLLILLLLFVIYFLVRPKGNDAGTGGVALTKKQEELKGKLEGIRDDFLNVVEEEGYSIKDFLEISFSETDMPTIFIKDGKDGGYLSVLDWDSLADDKKELINSWMEKTGSSWSGEEFFNKNFNWFGVPGELGRYMKLTKGIGNVKDGDNWDEELYVSKTAVNFWIKQGKGVEFQEFIDEITNVLAVSDSPTPQGKNDKEYFNSNYDEISKDIGKMSYYKFKLYIQAWDERGDVKKVVIEDLGIPDIKQVAEETTKATETTEETTQSAEEAPQESSSDTENVESNKPLESLRDAFLEAAKSEGYELKYVPEIVFKNDAVGSSFVENNENSGELVVSDWKSIPDDTKMILNSWMEKAGSDWTGEDFFNRNNNWFAVAREMGRYLYNTQDIGEFDENDYWSKELYANKSAINFFLSQCEGEKLESFMCEVDRVLDVLCSPTPECECDADYFNENYSELSKDMENYSYYQLMLYKKAWDER